MSGPYLDQTWKTCLYPEDFCGGNEKMYCQYICFKII